MKASYSPVEIDSMIGSVEENMAANPGYGELCNKLGLLYTLKGRFEEAGGQFRQCLTINPADIEARVNLVFLLFQQKKWEEAEKALEECLEIEPDHSLCNHLLGTVLLIRGNRGKAVKRFEKAAHQDAFYRLQYERLGALKGPEICLNPRTEKKLAERGESLHQVNLQHFVGQCYREMGETEKAIQEYRKASQIDSTDYKGYLIIGRLYDITGEYEKAIIEFKKAVEVFPDCGIAYAHMCYAYAGLGDFESALASLKEAVEIHPRYADLRYQLGLLYEDSEMYREAINELKIALEINQKFLFARINLGVLYEKMGQTEKAMQEYERVAQLLAEDQDLVDRILRFKKQTQCPPHSLSDRLEYPDES